MSDEGKPPCNARSAEYDRLEQALRDLRLPYELSHREIEIVAAAARGLDTKATAVELGVGPKTVDEYWSRVYRKLRCRSRLEVVALLNSAALLRAEAHLSLPRLVAPARRRR
jgi:DNA-binding NarL/FixJ family response regulator